MKLELITLYRCPECGGIMECLVESISNKLYEIWKCVECKRQFRLSFAEIKKVKRKGYS